MAGSPAEKGGVRRGDVLKSVAGFSVKTLRDMWGAIGTTEPGVNVPVVVTRDGREIILSVTPAARS